MHMGRRQNLDRPSEPQSGPLSGPLNVFFGQNKLMLYNTCATYHRFFRTLVSFDSAFSSKEGVTLHATKRFCLAFLRGIRNFLAISYLENFRETCHFK